MLLQKHQNTAVLCAHILLVLDFIIPLHFQLEVHSNRACFCLKWRHILVIKTISQQNYCHFRSIWNDHICTGAMLPNIFHDKFLICQKYIFIGPIS